MLLTLTAVWVSPIGLLARSENPMPSNAIPRATGKQRTSSARAQWDRSTRGTAAHQFDDAQEYAFDAAQATRSSLSREAYIRQFGTLMLAPLFLLAYATSYPGTECSRLIESLCMQPMSTRSRPRVCSTIFYRHTTFTPRPPSAPRRPSAQAKLAASRPQADGTLCPNKLGRAAARAEGQTPNLAPLARAEGRGVVCD